MALVARARCSFRGEDAGRVNSHSYWRNRDTRAEPVASSAAWGHRLYFANPSYTPGGPPSPVTSKRAVAIAGTSAP